MATVKEIYAALDEFAPFETQAEFDNAGFLVGRGDREVTGVLVALDITKTVIDEAVELGVELIVAHHPLVFDPIRSVTDESLTGQKLLQLAECGVAAICAHTNLDACQGGVNERLAHTLGLSDLEQLHCEGEDRFGRPYGIGRVGTVRTKSIVKVKDFAETVKEKLNASGVRYVDAGKPVCRVAVGGGSCGSMLADAVAAGCDTFITADVKYNVFLDAAELGINLLDAGHFATEDVITQPLVELLAEKFPDLTVRKSAVHHEAYSCV
ncbi:MAG: Nif3-like dinuclear metal center hexameric protein [Ruminococcaceae bacterium]|nr:Nif3-like dinuclear metal center hexameric protein [Oscillospiraceae bacterium]